MNKPILGQELGRQLCEAWGLDPNTVAAITIQCRPGEIARATIEYRIQDGIEPICAQYSLVPVQQEPPA